MTRSAGTIELARRGGVARLATRLLIAATVLAVIGGSGVRLVHDPSSGHLVVVFVVTTLSFLVVGGLVVERRRENLVGVLVLVLGLLIASYVVFDAWVRLEAPGHRYVALAVSLLDGPMFLALALLFLRFPDGKLPGPGWSWIVAASGVLASLVLIGAALRPGPFPYYTWLENPLPAVPNPITAAWDAIYGLLVGCVAIASFSLVGRWRRASRLERTQLKWVAAAGTLVALAMLTYGLSAGPGQYSEAGDLSVGLALALFPIAIGIAILRYRLYEIDRLITRTIGWTLTTGLIVAMFAGTVIGLQGILAPVTGGNTVAVAASTLTVAALFQPLRRGVQRVIDRRFDRARYDAQRTVEAFAARVRDEVDLSTLRATLATSAILRGPPRVDDGLAPKRRGIPAITDFVTLSERPFPRMFPMTALTRPFRRLLGRSVTSPAPPEDAAPAHASVDERPGVAVEIPESDPLFAYLQSSPGPVDLARLELTSPALEQLRTTGVALVVPLVTQGELIGTLNLGPRLSEQDYSSDDRRLLGTLAAQAAPAIRVAQLVREQAAEAAERERYANELKIAQLIQQQFLPHELPNLPEWQIAAYYGPARVVGGDFYDFIDLGKGRIGLVVGDVTDKGVPAALVMARTHSILRAEAPRLVAPGAVLARANDLLSAEMPDKMFVTCLYMVLEPATGHVTFANAGHNLPYVRTDSGVVEFRATGMPLGLLPGLTYEEKEADIGPGDSVLLYSDGIIEAHDPAGQMYGFPRLKDDMASDLAGAELLDELLDRLHAFTGRGWEQEDDITMVALRRSAGGGSAATGAGAD